jgi:predicted Zn finger-like uncharacterized protein
MVTVVCPECGEEFEVSDSDLKGGVFTCPECDEVFTDSDME